MQSIPASSSPLKPAVSPGASGSPAFLRNAIVLGLLTAIGPFAIDMYLPGLNDVAIGLHTTDAGALASMTVFFVTFALGQLIYGPSSDLLGRRRPLVVGLVLFILASVGCALATSIEQLLVFRMLQGFGGAAGMVIARAIVHDLHSGVEEARLLSLLMLVFSVSPICAPLLGNGVIAVIGWRGVFGFVAVLAVIDLALLAAYVPETRPPAARGDVRLSDVFTACRILLTDRHFVGLTLVSSFAFAGFLIYLSHSPLVLSKHYGMSSVQYSIAFSVNAVAFFAAAQLNGWLGKRFGLARLIAPAVVLYAITMGLACALPALGFDGFFVVAVLLFIGYGFLGILLPVSSVLALEHHGKIAGTASSLIGALQLATGAAAGAVAGIFANGTVVPMVGAIAASGGIALLVYLAIGRERRPG